MGTFEVGLNAFCIMIFLQAYGDRVWNVVVCDWPEGECNRLIGSDTISRCLIVGILWSCWRTCVSVEGDFAVLYIHKP